MPAGLQAPEDLLRIGYRVARDDHVIMLIRHIHLEIVHDPERDVLPAARGKIGLCGLDHAGRIVRAQDLCAAGELR